MKITPPPVDPKYTEGTQDWIKSYEDSLKEPFLKPRKECSDWVLAGVAFISLILLLTYLYFAKNI